MYVVRVNVGTKTAERGQMGTQAAKFSKQASEQLQVPSSNGREG